MWRCYLFDTMTGIIGAPIELPSFSWTADINSSTLSTTRDTRPGQLEASSLKVPWDAIPGRTQAAKAKEVASLRRSILVCWQGLDDLERPILAGAIGARTDTMNDTSFSLLSPYAMFASRFLVKDGTFGKNAHRGTSSAYTWKGFSRRAIACGVIQACTGDKLGGALPIDLPYLGEKGIHERNYKGSAVMSCKKILENLASDNGAPDMQIRPYLIDASHMRYRFIAGSDSEPHLPQRGLIKTLSCFRGGGTLQNISVAHAAPVERVYQTGEGQDEAMICAMAEDKTLITQRNPWPLAEASYQNQQLPKHLALSSAKAWLNASKRPALQLAGEINAQDPYAPELGTFWCGEQFDIDIADFPSIPDGIYRMRLMEMRGTESSSIKLTFDVMQDPIW